ncbi:6-phosphogluconolactonase [Leishmania major strain Friedlin]|uniref:6-phosphogluconolactonase n=1 Tax=Leishmania major TaxID=5664 RepID=Q4Q8S1_LEIMA|nr:6-phosphogluconolactonase [Leishmania major strain Friedlin]CAG9576600.1 6-phosphogluconolactonase [Leishmania major strain Friedlin]CAJ05676.1 6-phosphogluconolactonase [Leishmania major strain Friedlin]|eukprot:XP_001684277.1 6-phosphogluconolactonase [Leishmania major strain Friedlin]
MSSFAPNVKICEDISHISSAARDIILAAIDARVDKSAPVVLALSGGSTPKRLYEELHEKDLTLLQQHAVQFILGDERLVATDDEQSNFSMATKALLRDVPISDVIAIEPSAALATSKDEKGGVDGAWAVAQDYEKKLRNRLPCTQVNGTDMSVPIVDIVLLGFGADGHTASIFPDSVAATDESHVVSVSFPSPTMNPKVWRVTLSKTVIQHAKHVVVLACGKDKNWVVHGVLAEAPTGPLPVSRFLRECRGSVTMLLDAGSGEGLSA